jgi:hypothetical protein
MSALQILREGLITAAEMAALAFVAPPPRPNQPNRRPNHRRRRPDRAPTRLRELHQIATAIDAGCSALWPMCASASHLQRQRFDVDPAALLPLDDRTGIAHPSRRRFGRSARCRLR